MKTLITTISLLLSLTIVAQVERVNTKAVQKETAALNTEILLLDKNDASFLAFAKIVGIADDEFLQLEDLIIYPNPNDGFFTIRFKEIPEAKIEVIVYDITGQVVYTKSPVNHNEIVEIEVDIVNKPSGYYFLVIRQDNASQTRKIQKL